MLVSSAKSLISRIEDIPGQSFIKKIMEKRGQRIDLFRTP